MDEPLSARLDAELKISMRREIRTFTTVYRATIVYVTHDQSEALAMADGSLIMKNGKIEQVGTSEEIYLAIHRQSCSNICKGKSAIFVKGKME